MSEAEDRATTLTRIMNKQHEIKERLTTGESLTRPRETARDATRKISALAQTTESRKWVDAHWAQIVRAIEGAILEGKNEPL